MTTSTTSTSCSCSSTCLAYNDCCLDFLELCVFLPAAEIPAFPKKNYDINQNFSNSNLSQLKIKGNNNESTLALENYDDSERQVHRTISRANALIKNVEATDRNSPNSVPRLVEPTNNKVIQSKKNNHYGKKIIATNSKPYTKEDNTLRNDDQNNPDNQERNSTDNEDDDNGCFETLNVKLNECLNILGKLVVEVKDIKQRMIASNIGNFCDPENEITLKMKNDLPIDTTTAATNLDSQLLTSKEYHREFIRFVKQVGGSNAKDYTERVLNIIFSPKFARENKWEGKKNKFKVNALQLIKICEEILLKKLPTWDCAEFSKTGTNWFRLGNQRAGQQPGQLQKKNKIQVNSELDP